MALFDGEYFQEYSLAQDHYRRQLEGLETYENQLGHLYHHEEAPAQGHFDH